MTSLTNQKQHRMNTNQIKQVKKQLESMERGTARLEKIMSEAKNQILTRTEEDDINGTTYRIRKTFHKAVIARKDINELYDDILLDLWDKGIFL